MAIEEDTIFRKYKRSYSDIDTGLSRNPITGDVLSVKDENSVKQAVRNLLSTKFGERLMDPEIGSGIYESLFEPLDAFSAEKLREDIINTIRKYESRIVVQNCVVYAESEDSSEINIDLTYIIVGENVEQTSQIILQRPGS